MDDDEEVPHSWDVLVPAAAAVPVLAPREKATLAQQPLPKGRQGEYRAPQGGVVWLWRRDSQGYHALTIKDLDQNEDLCSTVFGLPVKAPSVARGRRTNTMLPAEDLSLLKDEMASPLFVLTPEGGKILDDQAVPDSCSFAELERLVGFACPWDEPKSHKVEMSDALKKHRRGPGRLHQAADAAAGGSQPVVGDGQEPSSASAPSTSQIEDALNCIATALKTLPDNAIGTSSTAQAKLEALRSFLKVTKGKQSRKEGGVEYMPTYILDSVLLADRLLRLEDMTDVIKECLVLVGSRGRGSAIGNDCYGSWLVGFTLVTTYFF